MPEEIELKLDAGPDGIRALDASGLLGDCTREAKLVAIYFDTNDRALWRNCASLRLRKEGRRTLQTVKQPAVAGGGIAARGEWEMPVKAGEPVADSRTPVSALLKAHGGTLQPVFEVHSHRTIWDLTSPGTRLEVAADDAEAVADERRGPFHEVEIEVREGPPAAAFALARRIDAVTPVRLGVLAKAERGFRLLEAEPEAEEAEHVTLDPDMTPVEAFALIARSCLRQYRLNENILLDRQSGEAVHQARVALRRLRSAMVLFRSLLPDDETKKRLAARIRALAQAFGEVRDFDVLAQEAPPGTLRERIEAARHDAYATLDGVLRGAEARHLPIDLAEWLATGSWQEDAATADAREMPLRKFAAKALDRLRKKVRRHGRHLASLDDETRHQLRKDVKKLRYGIEFMGPLFASKDQEKRGRKFLKALKKLQQELGVLNDLVTVQQRLAALDLSGTPEGGRFLSQWRKDRLLHHAADFRHDLLEETPFWR